MYPALAGAATLVRKRRPGSRFEPACRDEETRGSLPGFRSISSGRVDQLQPLVAPQVSHFSQVPLRTIVKFWHSEHMLPV